MFEMFCSRRARAGILAAILLCFVTASAPVVIASTQPPGAVAGLVATLQENLCPKA